MVSRLTAAPDAIVRVPGSKSLTNRAVLCAALAHGYRTAPDQLLAGDNGRSEISMEDFAVTLLDEVEQGRHVRQRFTAAW